MRAMTPTEAVAAAFIAQQTMHMNDHGVYGMTRKQRARVKALDVVSEERRNLAFDMVCFLPTDFGPPPHGDTGQMRVFNIDTGEIRDRRRRRRASWTSTWTPSSSSRWPHDGRPASSTWPPAPPSAHGWHMRPTSTRGRQRPPSCCRRPSWPQLWHMRFAARCSSDEAHQVGGDPSAAAATVRCQRSRRSTATCEMPPHHSGHHCGRTAGGYWKSWAEPPARSGRG